MGRSAHRALLASACGAAFALGLQTVAQAPALAQADGLEPPSFTADQAEAGAAAYALQCAACHGVELVGGQFGPALKGPSFLNRWSGAPLDELAAYLHASMPPANAGGLDDETYAAVLALIARENGVAPGDAPMPADITQLAGATMPPPPSLAGAFAALGIGGVSTAVPIPEWPSPPDRFAGYTPVTEAMLDDPAPENWMTWRRSHRGQGYSPLEEITTENVDGLQVAWAAALPPGPNMSEPLVRDGVLYVYAYGDNVFAFDAADGRVLWRYERHLPEGAPATSKKSLALWGDKLYLATTDLHIVALDARTGRPVWDRLITDKPGFRNPGGPLAADGVIMQGLTTQAAGGGLIAGFDAETGDHLWTFNTVAAPDAPGGDTWNGLPAEARSGGSSWTSGTYDVETDVALFGTGPTYDTGPLRHLVPGENNDALYTDTTLALRPRTGELVWFFQHMKNDQWDLDWVFDRVIGTIERDGQTRRVIMTSGKEGLFDTLDAATGDYMQTVDMGLQNFVTAIDPETGDKTIDPDLLPGGLDHPITVCPHGAGGRNWTPTAFNPDTAALFVTARDVCMEMIPVETGGFLSTHVNVATIVRPDSDGRYGLLQALDMEGGEPLWSWRQRAPHSTGVLATAGGLLFVGGVDRQFVAHDQATGEPLWRSGLTDTPNGSPISYAVDGKQYVAVVVGRGNPLSGFGGELIPEVGQAPVNGGGVYVFALPE